MSYFLLDIEAKNCGKCGIYLPMTEKKPDVVFNKSKEHMIGTVNKWVMQLELFMIMQKEGKLVDDFIFMLKTKNKLLFS